MSIARREDLRRVRVGTLPGHIRWTISLSLYGGGVVAWCVDWLTRHRRLLRRLQPTRLRNYVITRGHGLRLLRRDWHAVDELASWAVEHRPGGAQPADFYYRAQARRYALRVSDGIADADRATAELSATADPERHAGAVLEEGCLAIYQGSFEKARRAAFELRERTGRYAIPRWRAWGAWLEAIALCHLRRPTEARGFADLAAERFERENRRGPVADVVTARLLATRVELAQGAGSSFETALDDAQRLGGRYLDDRCLVLADLALAQGDVAAADELLHRVAGNPSCPVAEVWAALGLAELARLRGEIDAAGEQFAAVARLGQHTGAFWLQAQAAIGMRRCEVAEDDAWQSVPEAVRDAAGSDGFGDPRVLWMMTV